MCVCLWEPGDILRTNLLMEILTTQLTGLLIFHFQFHVDSCCKVKFGIWNLKLREKHRRDDFSEMAEREPDQTSNFPVRSPIMVHFLAKVVKFPGFSINSLYVQML
jgi:hypothetical protein